MSAALLLSDARNIYQPDNQAGLYSCIMRLSHDTNLCRHVCQGIICALEDCIVSQYLGVVLSHILNIGLAARIAHGISSEALSSTYSLTRASVAVAAGQSVFCNTFHNTLMSLVACSITALCSCLKLIKRFMVSVSHRNCAGLQSDASMGGVLSMQFQANLMERLQLLAQLHWALPHGLTLAEERLRDTELPQLTSECSALQSQVKVEPRTRCCICCHVVHVIMQGQTGLVVQVYTCSESCDVDCKTNGADAFKLSILDLHP